MPIVAAGGYGRWMRTRQVLKTIAIAMLLLFAAAPATPANELGGGWVSLPYNPSQKLDIKVELKINGSWLTVTGRARAAGQVQIKHAQSPGAIQPETSMCRLRLGNDDGWITEDNPMSPWYPHIGRGTPIRVSLAGILETDVGQFTGTIEQMQAVYPGGKSSSMDILAIGTWGGIAANNEPLRSPMYRTITGSTPGIPQPWAYWPMEDGADATVFASGLAGGKAAPILPGVAPAADATMLGSLPVATLDAGTGTAQVQFAIPTYADTGAWAIQVPVKLHSGAPGSGAQLWAHMPGNILALASIEPNFGLSLMVGTEELSDFFVTDTTFNGDVVDVWLLLVLAGDDTELFQAHLYNDQGISVASISQTAPAGRFGTVSLGTANPQGDASADLSLGHWAVYTDPAYQPTVHAPTIARSMSGFDGELVTDRLARLGAEEGKTITIVGTTDKTMGPQQPGTLAQNLLDCQQVDGGILSDSLTDQELIYRTLSDMYNQEPRFTARLGTWTPDMAPVWDNQQIANDWTVTRIGGASARAADDDHVAKIGRRILGTSPPLNTATDAMLDEQAGWRLRVGTAAGPRYPKAGINMRDSAAARLADAVVQLEAGDRAAGDASSLPPQHPPYGLDQLVIGWRVSLDAYEWLIRPVLVPYEPYAVGVAGDQATPGSWSQTGDDTQLVDELAEGATSALVHSDGPPFTTDGSELTYSRLELDVGGEACPVPATPGAQDTFTRSESNGFGGDWAILEGAPAQFAANGTAGEITIPTGSNDPHTIALPDTYTNGDFRATLRAGQLSTGASVHTYLLARLQDASNHYRLNLGFDIGGRVDVNLTTVVAGAGTNIALAGDHVAYSPGSDVHVHLQVHGARLRAKVWSGDANLPPSAWTVEAADDTYTSGRFGFKAQCTGPNTNTDPTVEIDNVFVGEAGIQPALLDTWARTAADTWGSADSGQTYQILDGVAEDFDTADGEGLITMGTGSLAARTIVLPGSYADFHLIGMVAAKQTSTGAAINQHLRLRHIDLTNYYRLGFIYGTDGNVDVNLQVQVDGVNTTLASVTDHVAYTPSAFILYRVLFIGSSLRAKIWTTATEPSNWTLEAADATFPAGQLGMRAQMDTGNTNTSPMVAFGQIEMLNPQRLTIARTLPITHPSGTPVKVRQPLIAAL